MSLAACTTQPACYRENCFVTETKITEDMQKIRKIVVEYYRAIIQTETEYKLKLTEMICKLFGKNNKQLNKEIDKLLKVFDTSQKRQTLKKLNDDLSMALKGLHLDFKQVLLLTKEIETDYAKITNENNKLFLPYKNRAIEIINFLDEKKRKEDFWLFGHYINDLNWNAMWEVYHTMKSIGFDRYNTSIIYANILWILQRYIKDGVLIDSFLEKHKSVISPKDEPHMDFTYNIESVLTIPTTKKGESLSESLWNAVLREKIDKQELLDLVGDAAYYMRNAIAGIVSIQLDITDKIDHDTWIAAYKERQFDNFYNYERQIITGLVDKYPKIEDFEREINKLATRLAYQIYYKTNIARFLYREWREKHYQQMDEFFANAVILADRLHDIVKDKVVPENASYKEKYLYKEAMKNISNVKEIANIGVEKIFSQVDCYIDPQEEIKKSLVKRFLKTREAYLKNTEKAQTR